MPLSDTRDATQSRDVLLFGHAAEVAGARQVVVPGLSTAGDLREWIVATYPKLAAMGRNLLIAVDHQYVDDDALLPSQAEIAVFPPVSGG